MITTFCTRATCRNKKCEKNQIYLERFLADKKNSGKMVELINFPKKNSIQCKGYK